MIIKKIIGEMIMMEIDIEIIEAEVEIISEEIEEEIDIINIDHLKVKGEIIENKNYKMKCKIEI